MDATSVQRENCDFGDEDVFLQTHFDTFERSLAAARRACLDQVDRNRYRLRQESHLQRDVLFSEDGVVDGEKPIDPRNEAAALSLLLKKIHTTESPTSSMKQYTEAVLKSDVLYGTDEACAKMPPECQPDTDDLERLKAFAIGYVLCQNEKRGVQMDERGLSLRGLCSDSDIQAGSCVLSLPSDLLISYKTAQTSDLGRALTAIGVTSEDLFAVVWTMIECRDPESEWRIVWDTLPKNLSTGLSFGEEHVELLRGTDAYEEIRSAQKVGYEDIQPFLHSLHVTYPDEVPLETISYASYLWAVQIWYAYAMEVQFPEGEIRSCLVPFACLMNHSSWPHIVRYGRIDPSTNSLRFSTFRPCRANEQLTLSYGPLSNRKLLIFYGFLLKKNPFDALTVDISMEEDNAQQHDGEIKSRLDAMGIASEIKLRDGPFTQHLVLSCNALAAPEAFLRESVAEIQQRKGPEMLNPLGAELLRRILQHMKASLVQPTAEQPTNINPIADLCLQYRSQQRQIIERNEQNVSIVL